MHGRMMIYEFSDHKDFHEACQEVKTQGIPFRAYSPVPEEDIIELRGCEARIVPLLTVGGGFAGFITGFFLQYYPNAIAYSINVGGKPLDSWPAFMVICFELTILFASFGALIGFFIYNGYPRFDKTIFLLDDFNQRRDVHFFLTTTKEVTLDKAIKRFDIPLS